MLWDGVGLPNPRAVYIHDRRPAISDVTGSIWQSYQLTPEQVPPGAHSVKVILVERNPRLACDIVMTDVELAVNYSK